MGSEAAAPVKAKKKIAIEEVDSSEAAAPVKAKKKIAVEAVGPKVPASLQKLAMKAPKTGYEMERALGKLKDPAEVAQYMDLIKPAGLPKLLSQDLTSEILMTLVQGIDSGLPGGADAGLRWLLTLPKVNRFDFIVDFLDAAEKTAIRAALGNLVAQGVGSESAERVKQNTSCDKLSNCSRIEINKS